MRRNGSMPGVRAALGACLIALLAFSANAAERVNKDANNIAILGYDTVAYHTEGRPIAGDQKFQHDWHDAKWHFSTAEHCDLFARDPQRYAPRYGGYCAGAMAAGWRVSVDPEAWVIIDDKLYLNYAKHRVDEFAANADDNIPRADNNWERLGKVTRPYTSKSVNQSRDAILQSIFAYLPLPKASRNRLASQK